MREWNLKTNDPLHLIIAADAQLTELDYANDHIWELSLVGGDPAALALQTSYGLRARSMRLFPQFISQGYTLRDPQNFFLPPVVKRNDSNFIEVCFSPFVEVNVQYEIWAASSHVLAGRFTFINQNNHTADFDFELTGLLNPLGREGRSMSVSQVGINHVLSGASEDLQLVCFMTGGPGANNSPLPGLSLKIGCLAAPPITGSASSLRSHPIWRATTAGSGRLAARNCSMPAGRSKFTPETQVGCCPSDNAKLLPGWSFPAECLPSFVWRGRLNRVVLARRWQRYSHLWNGQPSDAWYEQPAVAGHGTTRWLDRNFIAAATSRKLDCSGGGQRKRLLTFIGNLNLRVYEYLEMIRLERIYRLMGFIKTVQLANDSDRTDFSNGTSLPDC